MKSALLLGAWGLAAGQGQHPVRRELVELVNQQHLGWTAQDPAENPLAGYTPEQIRGLMGLRDYAPLSAAPSAPPSRLGDIPRAFDAREAWPGCKKPIRDQANCGSCWAVAAAETLTDNLCVTGKDVPPLSEQELVSCDTHAHGCHGGTLNVWTEFIQERGLVSEACNPYTSGDGKSNGTCTLKGCSAAGQDAAVYTCPVAPAMLNSDVEIQAAIMAAGAVEVGFFVYEDFMNYQSGVYNYSYGGVLGGHAVKVIGWGESAGMFYWIVQNSWGSGWGEEGFFRITNWKTDRKAAFAIGGGRACVVGPTPAPPSPPPAPVSCKDVVSYCGKYDRKACADKKDTVLPLCKKTCGCCGLLPPSYCKGSSDVEVLV